eukprot:2578809-Pleurochrysis_carterae.AAC.5
MISEVLDGRNDAYEVTSSVVSCRGESKQNRGGANGRGSTVWEKEYKCTWVHERLHALVRARALADTRSCECACVRARVRADWRALLYVLRCACASACACGCVRLRTCTFTYVLLLVCMLLAGTVLPPPEI